MCRRLAKLGYLAIVPALYARQGDVSKLGTIDEIRKLVATVPNEQVMFDLDASLVWAERNGGSLDHVGITGFYWGGRVTWLYTAHQPKIRAGIAWYGKLAGKVNPLTPAFPLDVTSRLKAPVLGLYGGQNQGIPLTDVEKMRVALNQAGNVSTIHVFRMRRMLFMRTTGPAIVRMPQRMAGCDCRYGLSNMVSNNL